MDEHRNIKLNKKNIRSSIRSRKRQNNPVKIWIFRSLSVLLSLLFLMSCIFLGYQIQGRREFAKNKVVETTRENQPGDGNLKETTRAEDSSAPEAANIRKLNLIGGQGEKIGVSLPNQFRERWTRFSKYFSETLKAAGYTPMVNFALKRPDKQIFQEPEIAVDKIAAQQIADLKTLYEEGCKVIFVAPVEVSSLQEVLTEIRDHGVTVIAINQLPMETTGLNYLIGYDDMSVGQTEAEYVLKALKLTGQSKESESADQNGVIEEARRIEIFAGDPMDRSLWFRIPGMMETLFPYMDDGRLSIPSGQKEMEQFTVEALSDRQEKANAKLRMAEILKKYYSNGKELNAVLCTDDLLAEGVSEAITEAMAAGTYTGSRPVITGDGGDEATINALRGGTQTMTIFRNPETLSGILTEAADRILHGQEPEINDTETYQNGSMIVPAYRMKPTALTKENLEKEYVEPGFALTAEIID